MPKYIKKIGTGKSARYIYKESTKPDKNEKINVDNLKFRLKNSRLSLTEWDKTIWKFKKQYGDIIDKKRFTDLVIHRQGKNSPIVKRMIKENKIYDINGKDYKQAKKIADTFDKLREHDWYNDSEMKPVGF